MTAAMNPSLTERLDSNQQRMVANVREAASRIWSHPLHRYFTDHTVTHSERILAILDGLTAGLMKTGRRLSEIEIFVLVAATYLHDIGMQDERLAAGDLDRIRDQHHQQSAEMIHSVFESPHSGLSSLRVMEDPTLVEAVALISKGHRKVPLGAAEYEPLAWGGGTIRLRLLAALLRFADELDIDHRRVDMERMKLLRLPAISQLHWWKCYYVAGVAIVDEYIQVSYRFPQDRPDYERLIVPRVEDEIRAKLAALEPIFRSEGVKPALAVPSVRLMRSVRPLPKEIEALFEAC